MHQRYICRERPERLGGSWGAASSYIGEFRFRPMTRLATCRFHSLSYWKTSPNKEAFHSYRMSHRFYRKTAQCFTFGCHRINRSDRWPPLSSVSNAAKLSRLLHTAVSAETSGVNGYCCAALVQPLAHNGLHSEATGTEADSARPARPVSVATTARRQKARSIGHRQIHRPRPTSLHMPLFAFPYGSICKQPARQQQTGRGW